MANPSIPEKNAKIVLQIYAHFDSQPGRVLRADNFLAVASRRRIPTSDLQIGLDYAAERNWIEKTEKGLRLTDAGFAAMPVLDRVH